MNAITGVLCWRAIGSSEGKSPEEEVVRWYSMLGKVSTVPRMMMRVMVGLNACE